VLGQARGDMGLVVLDRVHRPARFSGKLGREVVGMKVADDPLGPDAQQPAEVVGRRAVAAPRGGRREVADVLAQNNLAPGRERHGGLQVPAGRQHRREIEGDRNPQRGRPAPDAEPGRPAVDDPHESVISMPHDRTVVQEEGIGDPRQLGAGHVVLDRHRLVAGIGAGRDERAPGRAEQSLMDQRVADQGADRLQARRDRLGQGAARPTRNEHDRRRRATQQVARGRIDDGLAL
jgi:hypothetical protein